jgi:uncharacterized phage protein gp47/JayE
MTDTLNGDGLTIQSQDELITDLENAFKSIYGIDINLDSNTPDGQLLNIFAQAISDNRELALYIYNSFDLDNATGVILDQRVNLLGLKRKAGTFTIQPIEITVSDVVTLDGLDENFNVIDAVGYTVQDNAGNQFILVDTATLTVGTHELNFRAKEIGEVDVTSNTINLQSTVVLGVTNVNNTSGALQIGQNEESDFELRTRAKKSFALASSGYLNGLEGALLNLTGVTEAKVFENDTDVTDSNGIPAHTIWAIVEGGSNTDVANVIYTKKTAGCGTKGAVSVEISTISGDVKTFRFDRPIAVDLYIRFDLKPTISGVTFDLDGIKEYIETNLSYRIDEFAETSKPTSVAVEAINSTTSFGVPLNMEIGIINSTAGISWDDYFDSIIGSQFTVAKDNITITEI